MFSHTLTIILCVSYKYFFNVKEKGNVNLKKYQIYIAELYRVRMLTSSPEL